MSHFDQQHGYFWPKGNNAEMSRRRIRLPQALSTVKQILEKTKGRHTVVQAGGHVGLWPLELAKHFEHVYTFEPNWDNFHCLVRNVLAKNVYPMRAVLGETSGSVSMTRDKPFSGVHYVTPEAGPIRMLRVDDLGLTRCDALVLDVEGYEFPVIKGAYETIQRFHPTIVIENLPQHGLKLGTGTAEDIAGWLTVFGYGAGEKIAKRDLAFRVP